MRETQRVRMHNSTLHLSKLESSFMKNILESERQKKIEEEAREKEKEQNRTKMNNYSKAVREIYQPRVSPKKQKELEALIKKTKMRNKPIEVIYKNKKSMSKMSNLKSEMRSTNQNSEAEGEDQSRLLRSTRKIKFKKRRYHKNPMVPKPKLKRKGYVNDFLLKKRIQRENQEREEEEIGIQKRNKSHNWQNVSQDDIVDDEKISLIREKARAIEKESDMKNELLTHQGDLVDNSEANDLLINAIEAKLALFQNL